MGIKIHNNLAFRFKRIVNLKVFKNKFKSYLLQNCFYSLRELFLVTIDGSFVIRVCFDKIRKYTDGLCTVIFTKYVMLCFT
jgi:hypothetical protein